MTKSQATRNPSSVLLAGPPTDFKAALKVHVWRLLHADDPDAIAFRERHRALRPVLAQRPQPLSSLVQREERRLRLPEVLQQTGLVTSTLYRYIAQGTFPRPDQLGLNTVGWKQSEINEWLRTRKKRNPSPRRKTVADNQSNKYSPEAKE